MPFDSTLNTPSNEPTQAEVFAARLEKLADIAEKDDHPFNMTSWSTCLAGIACRSHEFSEFSAHYSTHIPHFIGYEGGRACKEYFGDHELFAVSEQANSIDKEWYVERLRKRAKQFRRELSLT